MTNINKKYSYIILLSLTGSYGGYYIGTRIINNLNKYIFYTLKGKNDEDKKILKQFALVGLFFGFAFACTTKSHFFNLLSRF